MDNSLPHTLTDVMFDAADALEEGDVERLEELLQHTATWMQTDTEEIALEHLLETMKEAAIELGDTILNARREL